MAAVITKSPEIIAVMCIPTPTNTTFPYTYAVFDSHARPKLHPTGLAFLFFPLIQQVAQYLSDLLRVDPSLLRQGDLQWQFEMLTTFSARIFSPFGAIAERASGRIEAHHLSTSWSMLYETSVELVQARGRIQLVEKDMADLGRENKRLANSVKALRSELHFIQSEVASHQCTNGHDHAKFSGSGGIGALSHGLLYFPPHH